MSTTLEGKKTETGVALLKHAPPHTNIKSSYC
jgi:hypothetical protein